MLAHASAAASCNDSAPRMPRSGERCLADLSAGIRHVASVVGEVAGGHRHAERLAQR